VGWSLLAAGVIADGVAAYEGYRAKQKGDQLTKDSHERQGLRSVAGDGRKNANIAAIALGIGGTALAITGIIVLATGGSSSEQTEKPATPVARLTLTPWISTGSSAAARGCSSRRMQSVRLSTLLHLKGWLLVALIRRRAVRLLQAQDQGRRLQCNLDAGVGKACPEGFKCDTARCSAGGCLETAVRYGRQLRKDRQRGGRRPRREADDLLRRSAGLHTAAGLVRSVLPDGLRLHGKMLGQHRR
jgi:hypothetical protein